MYSFRKAKNCLAATLNAQFLSTAVVRETSYRVLQHTRSNCAANQPVFNFPGLD
jgi:hypothetical protein